MNALSTAWHAATHAPPSALSFAQPLAFMALVVVVGAAWRLFFSRQGKVALLFSRGSALAALPKGAGHAWALFAQVALLATMLLVVVALARPQVPGEPDPAADEGIDIVCVLDISGSMRAADFKPRDRLHVAKKVIREHLLSRKRDRVGLVVFAGEAFTQAPLTHDKRLLGTVLDGVRTGVITDGTAIGDALATGINRLRDSKAKSRVIILVTDGDNNAGKLSPEKAAELAKEFDIKLFPILVGRGGRVPYPAGTDFFGAPRYEYMEWPTNPTLLKKIAVTTGGRFFSASNPAALVSSFTQILSEMDKTVLETGPVVTRPIDLYLLFLLPALLLLLLSMVVSTTKGSPIP